ncbi:uncharacterized protein LOC114416592 isoform X2 [Glycine soja]|uniref:uncharacterized protein LOC114416592 isoform X2 n=1 Tax=Glycine soja TaxID=3848 RepID=UPI00103DE5C5|nr:uncharacterized protein LOC114416592 isoform X2 [Glycine soja]
MDFFVTSRKGYRVGLISYSTSCVSKLIAFADDCIREYRKAGIELWRKCLGIRPGVMDGAISISAVQGRTVILVVILDVAISTVAVVTTQLALQREARGGVVGVMGAGLNIVIYFSPLSCHVGYIGSARFLSR